MLYLLQASQGSIPVWLAILLALIAASGSFLAGWATRKKPSQVQAENDRAAAEVRKLDIQSMADLAHQVRDTRAELAEIVRSQSFLREQVRWHEGLSIIARQAAHTAINEMQRCAFAIRIRDEAIKEERELLKAHNFPVERLSDVPEFELMNYDEITKYQSLPMPPKRLHP